MGCVPNWKPFNCWKQTAEKALRVHRIPVISSNFFRLHNLVVSNICGREKLEKSHTFPLAVIWFLKVREKKNKYKKKSSQNLWNDVYFNLKLNFWYYRIIRIFIQNFALNSHTVKALQSGFCLRGTNFKSKFVSSE